MWTPEPYVPPRSSALPRWRCRVVARHPHDPDAFTQGLCFVDGVLHEGTGLVGASSVRKVDLETGRVTALRELPPPHFGEGIAVLGTSLVQLTWQSEVGFVYDRDTLEPLGRFRYRGEGWGLAAAGDRLLMSDGSAWLRFLDPETFVERGRVRVTADGRPLRALNALAFVRDELWANLWGSDFIARIDPADGRVLGFVDCRGLLRPAEALFADVLNGIAHDPVGDRVFLTGKCWPWLFEVALVDDLDAPVRKP